MGKKISILLLLCIVIAVGLFYSKNGNTAQHSIPKRNFRSYFSSLRSAVYRIDNYTRVLIFDENSDALKELINLAEQGNVEVQYWLGTVYNERHKVDKAVKWYSKAGDQKNKDALFYLFDIAQKFNNKEAFQCLLRNTDDLNTKRLIGSLYGNKKTDFYNPTEAQKYFAEIKEAANKGISEAQYQLGIMYVNAQGVEKSFDNAIECYKAAAAQNHADALYTLGNIYIEGKLGIAKNTKEAISFYLKAAQLGHADAMMSLARIYEKGEIIKKNAHEAAQWCLKSIKNGYDGYSGIYTLFSNASKGDAEALSALIELGNDGYDEAQEYLGRMYDQKKDYKEAAKWYIKAYKLGYLNVVRDIERLYELGVPETVEVIKDFAYDGDKHAQAKLGQAYMRGLGVKKDYDEALKWLQKSSEQNDEFGHYLLATMYYNGLGVKQDYAKAAHFMARAVSLLHAGTLYRKDANIIYGRGLICRDGLYDVKPNKELALKLFIEAAQKGSIEANFTLGDMYEYGKDVKQDYNKAVEYYANAAQSDDKRSLAKLKSLADTGNTLAKQQYEAIVNYVRISLERKDYNEFIKICESGSLSKFKEKYTKLKLSPNANYRNKKDFIDDNLLSLAATSTSNVDIIKFLISKGADVNARTTGWRDLGPETVYVTDMTALMKASICYVEAKPKIVEALLDADAEINAKDSTGMTALDWAVETSTVPEATVSAKEVIKTLIEAGADAKDSLLYAFTENGPKPEVLKMLLDAGASVDNDSLMMAAINTEYPEVIELLLNAGANPKVKSEMKDFKGMRPIELAKDNPNLQGTNALKRLDEESYESPEEREKEEAEKKAAQQAEFQKLLQKAEQGDVIAQSNVGFKYLLGMDGVEIDGVKAIYWFKKAAEQNDMGAIVKLSSLYQNGDESAGIKKDEKEAKFWEQKADEIRYGRSKNTFQANASITGDKVNIRTKPTTSSSVVKQLNAGHPVKATKQTKAKDGTWFYIQTASGTQGWVFGKYVKIK